MDYQEMKQAIEIQRIESRYYEIRTSLYELLDDNPQRAIDAARSLAPDDILDASLIDGLKAGLLIDAGIEGQNQPAVQEGVAIFQRLLANAPDRGDTQYCLANGLTALADFVPFAGPEWYLKTADMRREARRLYQYAGAQAPTSDIKAQALTNLGNALLKAYRFVEAYDYYVKALESDPTNGVAATGAVRVLLWFAQEGIGDRDVLLGVAARHLRNAHANPQRIRELAGLQAYEALSELLGAQITGGEPPDLSTASDYQRFVAKYRLTLAPTIEGLDLTMSRWDSLRVESISEPVDTEHGIPPLFAMFNVLKAEYLTARFLAYSALNSKIPESGNYSDTLDYACYGIRTSLLTLSQRSCIDILDKIAVATSEYLDLPGPSKSITFLKRWFIEQKEKKQPQWQPQVEEEIAHGNTALIALSEVSGDIATGGFLQTKRTMRHSSTHRFTVLHDLGGAPSRACHHIDHYEMEAFIDQLIETLQLTRAILFYFVEMIMLREEQLSRDGTLRLPLFVPDHAQIRGEDNR
jgi:tetratricopeptide (TPR) repeat protein